jgi:hypothetical protein
MPAALIPHAHHQARSINFDTLSPEQRALLADSLWALGIDRGHTSNDGGSTAAAIGLHLPDGDEIAQCGICDTVAPTCDMHEGHDGVWRCTIADPDGTTCLGIYLGTE